MFKNVKVTLYTIHISDFMEKKILCVHKIGFFVTKITASHPVRILCILNLTTSTYMFRETYITCIEKCNNSY